MSPPTNVIGRRVVAFLLDAVVLWAVSLIAFVLVADQTAVETGSSAATMNLSFGDDDYSLHGGAATLFGFVAVVAWISYLGVLPGITGWTPGKLLTGVRVVDAAGQPPGAAKGVVRSFVWLVDGFPYVLPGLTGFIVALSTQRHQRVGDQIAQTYVVVAGTVPEAEERPLAAGAPPAAAAAGWYADPQGEERLRYWDGYNWTANTAP